MSRNTPGGSNLSSKRWVFGWVIRFDLCGINSPVRASLFPSLFVAIFLCVSGVSSASGQTPVYTQHYDNSRTGQNTTETILTPANVNSAQFGKLFTQSLDGMEAAQPLYVPGVYIPATNSLHNVVYAVTLHDSVYAFDADNNQGSNASPLWYVNFLNPASGITSVPASDENCDVSGYKEFGIQGTPVIDPTGNAIYVLAMTKENGAYVHRLHALDLGTGGELFGGPVTITASVTINNQTYTFIDKYQQERPALLLQDGIVYLGFGSCGCNIASENGWVMAYQTGTLQQVGVFDASPGVDASAVWMSGAGLVGDGQGNVYANTGDGLFDASNGGSHYGDSVLKFNQGDGVLNLVDYFTPYDQKYFQANDLDVSSGGITLLPSTPQGDFFVAIDKNGALYLLNQADLGQYNPISDTQIQQEIDTPVLGEVHAGLTYWNNNVYVSAYKTPVLAYSFANGQLSQTPTSQTPSVTSNPQGGIVSSNGDVNGIYWYVSVPTPRLFAFDATNLANPFYSSATVPTRDALGTVVHFPMPIVADGRVYVDGQTQLSVYGLLPAFTAAAGNNQNGVEGTTLPIPLQAALQDPYSGNPIQTAGIPVTFAASGKVGSFSNPTAITDSTGTATTSYTLSTKPGTYTITASSLGYASASFVVTGTSSGPTAMSISSGNSQKAPVMSPLPLPLNVKVKDSANNGLAGVQVSFSDGGVGGSFASPIATTNSSGIASTTYTTGPKSGATQITASVSGLTQVAFKESVLAGAAAALNLYSGNNQTVKPGAATSKMLEVVVTDQYGNLVSQAPVTFSDGGAGGSFSADPALSSSAGIAEARYTAPLTAGPVTITASENVAGSVSFTVNVN
jgi:hypothetical protein